MKIGTRSLLFGAHQFLIHPVFVFIAWWQLYGFPADPRLWVAFLVHDWGYWGSPNMDGPEGELHPQLGARIMNRLFDRLDPACKECHGVGKYWKLSYSMSGHPEQEGADCPDCNKWGHFTLYHSRFLARAHGETCSRLCCADKLATCLEPAWIYLPRVWVTGELKEYMATAGNKPGSKYTRSDRSHNDPEIMRLLDEEKPRSWHKAMVTSMGRWAWEHRNEVAP